MEQPGERGMAMVAVLAAVLIVTMISLALVGLMNTDLTHASIQSAVTRSFYIARAGLEEAKAQVSAAADPAAYATSAAGVTMPYGTGQFTYWVDAGPAAGCGPGLKTLEALGQVSFLSRTFPTRVRACGVPGVPFLAALFGVSLVQFQGASSRTYLAPYLIGTPGGGGSVGSFTEINFSDNDVRVNALSEEFNDAVTLRDGTFSDYMLFGFTQRPNYTPTPMADPAPWILSVFGDLVKGQPTPGSIPNACGTPYACVTVGNKARDIQQIGDLREGDYAHRVYMNAIRQEAMPRLFLDPAAFLAQAERNTANAVLNTSIGFNDRDDSVYTSEQFSRVTRYLARNPSQFLRGTIYVEGTFGFSRSVNLGGPSGNVTLVVAGDLIVFKGVTVTNRHDLSTVAGRRTPGIVVLGASDPVGWPAEPCGEHLAGSGRLVMCPGSTLVADGLVYTEDGMATASHAAVDQIGAMYHGNRGTPNPSFVSHDATLVLRFDPLALSVFGNGVAVVSWQQLP
jgi:hypothetical protein